MKGIVFTEFQELVETAYSDEMYDRIVEAANNPSGSIYTSVGTYDYRELITLVVQLSEFTKTPVPDLVFAFGQHLFGRFVDLFPHFFVGIADAPTFLASVDSFIHVEVKKN